MINTATINNMDKKTKLRTGMKTYQYYWILAWMTDNTKIQGAIDPS